MTEKETYKNLWDFEIQTDPQILTRISDLVIITKNKNKTKQNKKRELDIKCILLFHWVKIKENENRDKYSDLARELRKLWNMRVTVKSIVIGAFETLPQKLGKRTGSVGNPGRGIETTQTTALLGSARILGRVLETWGDLLSLKLRWKTYQLTLMWKTHKVTQTPVKNHQLTLMWKTLKE